MFISAVLIVKNEEPEIAGCLESLAGVDEIIVCDTGSTDHTIELARRYTDKVFTDFAWCDDFAAARNHARGKASGNRVLSIDADERLLPGSLGLLRQCDNEPAYSVTLVSRGSGHRHEAVRFFHPSLEWVGAIHEVIPVADAPRSGASVEYGYSAAHDADPDRALRILTAQRQRTPSCTRTMYYLAREHYYRKEWGLAEKLLSRYLRVARWLPEKADAFLMRARCLWNLQRGDEARDACLQALNCNANFKEAAGFMAEITWPANARVWRAMAAAASNEGVLFVRTIGEVSNG